MMSQPTSHKTVTVSIETPAGDIDMPLAVPDGFIPITEIISTLQLLGERAQQLEVQSTIKSGHAVSCKQGCAACCRMMIPVSPPEAFKLWRMVQDLPAGQHERVLERVQAIQSALAASNILDRLKELGESSRQFTDSDLEPLNRAYYALRMPCPFLEDESCSIYESRPSACRELLVTSPAKLCNDMAQNPVRTVSIPVRIGTVLSSVWSQLVGGPTRLIPLPLALEWAERHQAMSSHTWEGKQVFERALTIAADLLKRFFRDRKAGT